MSGLGNILHIMYKKSILVGVNHFHIYSFGLSKVSSDVYIIK